MSRTKKTAPKKAPKSNPALITGPVASTRRKQGFAVPNHTCSSCGCHDQMACVHPDHGACWWVTNEICSHCHMEQKGLIEPGEVLRPWQDQHKTVGQEMINGRLK